MAEVSRPRSNETSALPEKADGSHGEPEPVMVMHYNKPSVVIVAASEYARLNGAKRLLASDLPEWPVDQIGTAGGPRFAHLDEAG